MQMEPLYKTYKSDGFEIAAFPCNQFKHQEPGNATQIKEFIRVKYFGTWDLYAKIDTNGPHAHPMYKFLKDRQQDADGSVDIQWNFAKFLIDRRGVPVRRYLPQTPPYEFENDIVRLLGVQQKPKPPMRAPLNDTQLAAAAVSGTGATSFLLF